MSDTTWTKGPLFVGAMNDALFIIDTPPRPAPVDDLTPGNAATRVIAKMGQTDREAGATAQLFACSPELYDALDELRSVINAAGLLNLSSGVQLGKTSWYVKASDAMESAERALAKATPSRRFDAQVSG